MKAYACAERTEPRSPEWPASCAHCACPSSAFPGVPLQSEAGVGDIGGWTVWSWKVLVVKGSNELGCRVVLPSVQNITLDP